MRKPLLLCLAVLALVAARPAVAQNSDPASASAVKIGIAPVPHVAVAHTGAAVDRAGYAGAFWFVQAGYSVNAAGTPVYVVLQDSATTGSGWNLVDSVKTDTVDNSVYAGKSYKGVNRFLRLVARAASANDTTILSASIVLTNKRTRP